MKQISVLIAGALVIANVWVWAKIYETEVENARIQQQIDAAKTKMRFVDILLGEEDRES